ncbi:MAG: thiamine-phosphate pyrophosphorylase [Candidatus Omnitrophica bacterium]|nr:thiamine-phosphate pyrophosphorylase [Candidatus Omnitrophota bacterium]MDD5591726.1 thiamine-phosphate pyrophosphorylase [Candidatus Omnitrophota bacterium]
MPKPDRKKIVHRIIDANINRATEGLRVCEEVTRFILNDKGLTTSFKKIRHGINTILKCLPKKTELLRYRQSRNDVGKGIYINELKRSNYQEIFFANIQRVKESIRVLEEFSKLMNKKTAVGFKRLRYGIYELERKTAKKIFPGIETRL